MGVSVNSIPSMNVPFVDNQGRINPIWHEFLRKFVAATVETSEEDDSSDVTVEAGAGLTKTDSTLNVGAGAGITVNADDVNVDIVGQTSVQAELDDELMIADRSDNNAIRKTKIREIVNRVSIEPGGSNSEVQYNTNGVFGGDSRFTHDGTGTVNVRYLIVSGADDADETRTNIKLVDTSGNYENKIFWTNTIGDGSTNPTAYFLGSAGGTPFIQGPDNNYRVTTQNNGFQISFGSGRSIDFRDSDPGIRVNGNVGIHRSIQTGITASTTQTQGSLYVTKDINEISICANANDAVTLPDAIAARHCLVINNGAQTLQVFPVSGDNLGAGVNASTTIAAGSCKLFIGLDATNWKAII